MIPQFVVLYGVYRILRDKKPAPQVGDPDYEPPTNITPEGDDYRVSFVQDGVDKDYIWLLEQRTGALYSDGSGEIVFVDVGYIIGNQDGTGFTSAPTNVGGTITFDIGENRYSNVLVYADLEDAIAETTEEEAQPDDPVKPPEEPELPPTLPDFPERPDFGLGGGMGSFVGGGY